MPKDKLESQTGTESFVRVPMEISPEVLELMQREATPSEFLKIAREGVPRTQRLSPITPYNFSAYSKRQRPYVRRPMPETTSEPWPEGLSDPQLKKTVGAELKEIPWTAQGGSLEYPEEVGEIRAGGEAPIFYLTDLTFNVSGVSPMTPGLRHLAHSTLGQIVPNLAACFEVGEEDSDEVPIEEIKRRQQAMEKLIAELRDSLVDDLIKLLGAGMYSTRETAEAEIKRIAESEPDVVDALIPHLSSSDPEIRVRVRRLLRYFSELEADQYDRQFKQLMSQKIELEGSFGWDSKLAEEAEADVEEANEDMEDAKKDILRSGAEERRQRAEARENRSQEREEKLRIYKQKQREKLFKELEGR